MKSLTIFSALIPIAAASAIAQTTIISKTKNLGTGANQIELKARGLDPSNPDKVTDIRLNLNVDPKNTATFEAQTALSNGKPNDELDDTGVTFTIGNVSGLPAGHTLRINGAVLVNRPQKINGQTTTNARVLINNQTLNLENRREKIYTTPAQSLSIQAVDRNIATQYTTNLRVKRLIFEVSPNDSIPSETMKNAIVVYQDGNKTTRRELSGVSSQLTSNNVDYLQNGYKFNKDGSLELTLRNISGNRIRLDSLKLEGSNLARSIDVHYTATNGIGSSNRLTNPAVASNSLLDFELKTSLLDNTLEIEEEATFVISSSSDKPVTIDSFGVDAEFQAYEARPRFITENHSKNPNIVILYADDIGIGDFSAYGFDSTLTKTPAIDKIAADGMLFTNCHSAGTKCGPSRYGMMTGHIPSREVEILGDSGGRIVGRSVLEKQVTLAEILKRGNSEYRTYYVGKSHLHGGLYTNSGAVWTGNNQNPDYENIDFARGYVDGVDKHGFDQSFLSEEGIQHPPFVYFHNNKLVRWTDFDPSFKRGKWEGKWTFGSNFNDKFKRSDQIPYRIIQTEDPLQAGYANPDIDGDGIENEYSSIGKDFCWGLPSFDVTKTGEVYVQATLNFLDNHAKKHSDKPFFLHFNSQAAHAPKIPSTFLGQKVKGSYTAPETNPKKIARAERAGKVALKGSDYLDMLNEFELQVERIMDKLRERNLLDNTLIIVTSDNGSATTIQLDTHRSGGPYSGRKRSLKEGGHRVPCIMTWYLGNNATGNIPSGTVCENLVRQIDFLATFADITGADLNEDEAIDSVSILPYILGDQSEILVDANYAGFQNPKDFTLPEFPAVSPSKKDATRFQYRDWKVLIKGTSDNGVTTGSEVVGLFHLPSDLGEKTNLAKDPRYKKLGKNLLKLSNEFRINGNPNLATRLANSRR